MDDDFLWLLKWFHAHCDGTWEFHNEVEWQTRCDTEQERDKAIVIETFDNPGWGLIVRLDETELEHRIFHTVKDIHRSEHDWISLMKREGRFRAAGGPFNFPQILQAFRRWAEKGDDIVQVTPQNFEWTHIAMHPPGYQQNMNQIQDNLTWLMTWRYSQWDGDWEHSYGIEMHNYKGSNWYFRVSINYTALCDQPFEEVSIQRSETDWLRCSIKKTPAHDTFEGYGGAFNLPEIIRIFRQWAQSIYGKYPIDPRHLED